MSIHTRNNLIFPALMEDIFKPDWFGGMINKNTNIPAVNIKENKTSFNLELVIPGFKKSNVNIEIDDSILTISSAINSINKTDAADYTRKEFSLLPFKRIFTLPDSIDESKIEATYEDGILKLSLPKKEEALPKPKRLVEIV